MKEPKEVPEIKSILSVLKKNFIQTDRDGILILICTVSIFLPFYLCIIPLLLTFIHIILEYKKNSGIFTPPHSIWFYAFAVYGVTVGAVYQNWLGVFVFGLVIIMFMLGFYFESVMTRKLLHDIIFIVSIGGIAAAIVAFFQIFHNIHFRSVSVFGNANYYAFVCELCIVALVYAIYEYGKKPLFFAAIAANLCGIAASGCRTAWVAFFAGIIVVMFCLKKYRHILIMFGIAIIAAIGMILLPQFMFPRYEKFDNDKTLRILIWKTTLGFIKTHPFFGQGMLTYLTLSTGRAHDAHAHDLILEFLLDFGIIGTIIAAIFAVRVIRDVINNIHINSACAAVLGVAAAAFVHGFTDLPFIGPQTGAALAIMLSLSGICGKYRAQNFQVK